MARVGSLVNMLADGAQEIEKPEVGMGATYIGWSDREPFTVVEVSKTGHRIVVQADDARRTDSNGMSECQSYEFTPNPNGHRVVATRRKDGSYRVKGGQTRILLGVRQKYYDYSF